MNSRIVYLNTFGWGNGHEMFNATLLALGIELSMGQPVLCRATKSNFSAMTRLLSKHGIDYSNIRHKIVHTIGGKGRYSLLGRYILGIFLNLWYLIRSCKTDLILIPFNNLFAIKYINLLNRLLNRSILIFCHGEMEFVASDVNKHGLLSVQLYNRCRRFFLNPDTKVSEGIYFSVLGDKIKENLKAYIPQHIWDHFVVMDHPYFFTEHNLNPDIQEKGRTIKLGTCGAMTYSKGVLDMAVFASRCKGNKLNVSITHIGRVFGGLAELQQCGVIIPSADHELSREEYNRHIDQLDFLLFFYPRSNYKITASGAIMDAIALRKPIIAIRNDYFEYIFEKFGAFGYLVDSLDEMIETIRLLCDRKLFMTFDFDSIQNRLTPCARFAQLDHIVRQVLTER